jgi:hypothetical protein
VKVTVYLQRVQKASSFLIMAHKLLQRRVYLGVMRFSSVVLPTYLPEIVILTKNVYCALYVGYYAATVED